jgi:autotransporter-associated beta strand protein
MIAAASSSAQALPKGQQWFVDNGIQITGLIGNPAGGNPFHLSTYQSMGYTTEVWEWVTDPSQLTMSWGRWVTQVSNLPPVGGESSHMSTLRHLNLGTPDGDEANLNDPTVRNQQVTFFNQAHANSAFNSVLLWNNNYGGQVNDASLGDFISRAQPDMISFDTYPYAPNAQPAGGSPLNWYGDFRRFRQWGMDTSTPLGFYRQTYASPGGAPSTREISQSEMSLQTFAGLAFNAKFISDFTYNFNGNTMFSGGGDNNITPLGTAAQTINAEVKRLGPALVRLKPVIDQTTPSYTSSMMFVRGKNTNASTYNAIPVGFIADPQNNAYTDWVQGRNDPYMLEPTTATNLGSKNNSLPGDVIIAWFRVMDESFDGPYTDERYFMVTNGLADMNATAAQTQQSITLSFNFGASGISQLQRLSRSTGLVEDVNLTSLGGSSYSLTLTLDGGRGDLFKFKDGAPFVGIDVIPPSVYWDSDGNAGNNNLATGAGLGGSGTWDASARWYNGTSDIAWTTGSNAVFLGTAATVALASPQSVGSLAFKSNGYVIAGSTLTLVGPSITVDAGDTATISSVIAGSNGLTKSGPGTLNLTGSNTYTGGTTITDGVLGIIASSLGASPASPSVNLSISNGASLRFNADGITLPVNRQIALGSGGGVFDTNGNNATIAGVISGLALTKTGAGTLVLANASNTHASTTVTGGTLQISSDSALGAVPGTLATNITLDGGTLQCAAGFTINANRGINLGAAGGTIDVQGAGTTIAYNPTNGFRGGDLNKTGAGTFLAGATSGGLNTLWTGNLIIKQGTWKIVATDGLPMNPTTGNLRAAHVTLDGGTWQFGASLFASQPNRGITVNAGGGTIDTQGFDITWAGPIAGSVASATLTKIGAGLLRLNSTTYTSNYVGNVQVNAGTLQLNGGSAMGDLAAINLADAPGVTLNLTSSETIGSLSGGGTSGGNTMLNAATLTTGGNGNSTIYSGVLSGTGGITKLGAGTMTLAGISTYTGPTTVFVGKVIFAANFTSSASLTLQNGARAELAQGGNYVIKTPALSVIGTAKLNLADNKLITQSPVGSWNGSAYTGVTALMASGRNSGTWNGNGIITSMTDATNGSNHTSIGIAKGVEVRQSSATTTALWGGQTITGTDTLVMYTYGGDATLDGKINIDDYVRIDQGIAGGLSGWANGDFNYDGKVNIDDYTTVIDVNIGSQGPPFDTSAGFESRVTAVPEPAWITAAFAWSLLCPRQRRRA